MTIKHKLETRRGRANVDAQLSATKSKLSLGDLWNVRKVNMKPSGGLR
jgi:hypothetical protein